MAEDVGAGRNIEDDNRRIIADPQHLMFAVSLFGSQEAVDVSLGDGANEELAKVRAVYDAQPLSLNEARLFGDSATQGAVAAFLVMSRASGEDITLTAADVAIIVNPYLHYDLTVQPRDRLHRIGQRRARVAVYHLLRSEAIERRMVELRDKKIASSSLVISQSARTLAKMDCEEVLQLLGG